MKFKAENPRRKTNRSKNAARVDRQLEALKAEPAQGANVTEVASTMEEAVKDAAEAGNTTTTQPQVEFTRGQLGKAERAFAKAGQPEASEEVRRKWLAEVSAANIVVMGFSSSRLAKVIKGEISVAELRE